MVSARLDEGVFGPDHSQYRSRHSHVEAHGDSLDRSKVRFANGGTRKRIGHHRGSVRAPARIAMSCETLLARGRSDESPLGHRVSAWSPRMPVHRVVADVTRNARIGRKCHLTATP